MCSSDLRLLFRTGTQVGHEIRAAIPQHLGFGPCILRISIEVCFEKLK